MPATTALFFDVGGVILTNGWDRPARLRAAATFQLDWDAFEQRHEPVVAGFETGRIGLDDYLDCTIFYEQRTFTRQQFKDFMFAQSEPLPAALAIVEALTHRKQYLMATLNNESFALNRYRIERFQLRNYFDVFFSSCYCGLRKPDQRFYKLVLQLTQRREDECIFIDDRALNIECAERLGMRTLHYRDAAQLENELKKIGLL